MSTQATQWRQIRGWPYEVSEHGEVRNMRTGRVLRARLHKSGYLCVQLWDKRAYWTTGAHQLVAAAFHGERPSAKHEVGHKDGNRTNNHESNLGWVTHLQNMRERDVHGTTARGKRNGKTKHPDETVALVRQLHAQGMSYARISAHTGLSNSTVESYAAGRRRQLLITESTTMKHQHKGDTA